MAFDDLDLEFEDEEEAKKKKNEAVQVDVDLEFAAPEGGGAVKPKAKVLPAQGATNPRVAQPGAVARPGAVVQKLDDARAAQAKRPVAQVQAVANSAAPRSVGSSALKEDHFEVEAQEVVELREQMKRVEFEADVKVAVAEFKTELLSELAGDMKLMEHQIGQLLVRINAKHPDMKQEVLMIKKVLADFTAKKRK